LGTNSGQCFIYEYGYFHSLKLIPRPLKKYNSPKPGLPPTLAAARVGKPAFEQAVCSAWQERLLKAEKALAETSRSKQDTRDGRVTCEKQKDRQKRAVMKQRALEAGEELVSAQELLLVPPGSAH